MSGLTAEQKLIVSITSNGLAVIAKLLTVLFVILKLTKVIAWSWYWVLCPVFIVFGAIGLIVALGLVAAVIGALL